MIEEIDPYDSNILVAKLGPIPTPEELLSRLTITTKDRDRIEKIPRHKRLHYLCELRDIHIPSSEGRRIAESIDLMIRQGYKYRDPEKAATWQLISGENLFYAPGPTPTIASVVVGHSGTGKTQTVHRSLSYYPQIVRHERFPQMAAAHYQVTWLSLNVPASGKNVDLAINLCRAWDDMLRYHFPGSPTRFGRLLSASNPKSRSLLGEWLQTAKSHFLGIVHLDEVQNLFRLPSLSQRRSLRGYSLPELSIVEDEALKWILELTNTWKIPLLVSGTPDGVGALMRRLSNTQRFVSLGYHELKPFAGPNDRTFKEIFLPTLLKQQWLSKRLEESEELRKKIHDYTAGIPRLIIALWFAAQRIALDRSQGDELLLADLDQAIRGPLKPVRPAVNALNSGDSKKMARYEDLIRLDDGYWEEFWRAH